MASTSRAADTKGAGHVADTGHPYYPWDLKLPHYVPNTKSALELLSIFGACALLLIIITWVITRRKQGEPFCFLRRVVLCWFILCGFIHTFFEGYFSYYHKELAGHSSIFGQLWKEYSKSDSRYMSSDTFTVSMESITAVIDGPLAFVAFFSFMTGNNYRYVFQMLVSVCQLYGDSLYLITAWMEGFKHGPYGNAYYFGFYFLFLNLLWIFIPILLIIDAAKHMAACQIVSDFYIDEYNRKVKLRKRM